MLPEEQVINEIVNNVLNRLRDQDEFKIKEITGTNLGLFDDVDTAVNAAKRAQRKLRSVSIAEREKYIASIREVILQNVNILAQLAVQETGMGRVEDKIIKNRLAAEKTPGTADLTAEAFTGDHGLTLVEMGPYGVIGAITPSTNPSETVINNSIGMIAAGNSVVFNVHPGAKNTSLLAVKLINEAIAKAGGPANLVCAIKEPTIETAQQLMKHPDIALLVVTGGPQVVRTALSSGKKTIGAGAGNPPVVVDETANLRKAAQDIVKGASFDNNLPCTSEKVLIVVGKVADELLKYMQGCGAWLADRQVIKQLEQLVLDKNAKGEVYCGFGVNKKFIGKNADWILEQIGIKVPEETRLILAEVEAEHPFVQLEMLMPILPVVQVKDVDQAIELAVQVEHGNRHTAIMHSTNVNNMTKFAREIDTTIFVKNGPSYAGIGAGGEGYTTFTIAGPTGEGLTSARSFTRKRRCVLVDGFSIV